jgi:hypothetical protein
MKKLNNNNAGRLLLVSAVGATLLMQQVINGRLSAADDTVPLTIKWPMPTLKGTPDDLPTGPHIEKLPDKAPPPVMVPKGAVNVAKGKKVTGSDKNPITGNLSQITDGDREAFDDQVVEMRKGTQWIQIDLEGDYAIHAVAIWHDHRWIQVFRDVVVQVAEDADFTKNVQTIFNNDLDNSSGLGIGTNKEYFETQWGKVMAAKGEKARYVRCYTKGSNMSALNCIQEVDVYALPAK